MLALRGHAGLPLEFHACNSVLQSSMPVTRRRVPILIGCLPWALLAHGCSDGRTGPRSTGAADVPSEGSDEATPEGDDSAVFAVPFPSDEATAAVGGSPGPAEMAPSLLDTAGAMDPEASAALCASLGADRAVQSLLAVNRLGLEMSATRVEGTVSEPVIDAYGNALATLEIEKVWVGPTFLEGARTRIDMDAGELSGLEVPGRYILGFGSMVSGVGANALPVRGEAGALSLWDKQVMIPSAERDRFADLLSYGIQGEPLVAVVEVTTPNDYGSRLAVIETLAGEMPDVITMHWEGPLFGASFPSVGPQRYLATFVSIYRHELSGNHFGSVRDFRPYDVAARATVERELAAPLPARDVQDSLKAALEQRMAWVVHRAPLVVATQISGIAHECCSGAGGTYFSHDVLGVFRGGAATPRLMLGGHDYFSDERCGDAFLLAIGGVESADPALPASAFACGAPGESPSVDWLSVPHVDARLVDTEGNRALVNRWLRSPEPRLLLRRDADERAPFALGPDAVWSQPLSVEQALVTAELRWINVVGVDESTGRIVIETTFGELPFDHLPRQRFELDADCAEPLLSRPGERLVPLAVDDPSVAIESGTEADAFLVPGVVLPSYGYVYRTAQKYRYAVGAY
jgi:hypothetical protein